MSFGAFMEGVKGGMQTTQNYRRQKQLDELYDAAIRKAKTGESGWTEDVEAVGGTPSDYTTGDPFGDLLGKIRGLFGKEKSPTKEAIPIGASPQATLEAASPYDEDQPLEGFGASAYGFADGGYEGRFIDDEPTSKQRDLDEIRRRAEERARREARPPPDVTVDRTAPRAAVPPTAPTTPAAPGMVARARSAIGRSPIKAGGLAGFGILGAIEGAGTDTEDYRRRFGLELKPGEDPSFLGELGIRSAGVLSDVANQFTFGQLGRLYRDKQTPTPTPTPTAVPVAPTAAPTAPAAPTASAPAAPRAAVPTAPPAAQPAAAPEPIDMSKVRPVDVPDFSTRDWADYRTRAIRTAVIQGGMSLTDAESAVDQKVLQMQQQGFNAYLSQARTLLAAGNLEGAASAATAAYRYFPTGQDARAGVINGKVVMFPIDEETGEPDGDPVVLTDKLLEGLQIQIANPLSFANLTKDRALAESRMRLETMTGDASFLNALSGSDRATADLIKQSGIGGAGGGTSQSSLLSQYRDTRNIVNDYIADELFGLSEKYPLLKEPEARLAIAATINEAKRDPKYSAMSTEEILQVIIQRATASNQ